MSKIKWVKSSNSTIEPVITNNGLSVSSVYNKALAVSSVSFNSGKWYCEIKIDKSSFGGVAIYSKDFSQTKGYYINGQKIDTGNSFTNYGASFTTGDTIGIAVDLDAKSVTFYKNGASQGIAFSNLTNTDYVIGTYSGTSNSGESYLSSYTANFGETTLQYSIPSGFRKLTDLVLFNKILLLQENGEVNSIDSISKAITKLPTASEQNLVKYGMDSPVQVDGIFSNKNYILSKNESENADGLWVQEIDRKPLSIKFE